MKFKLDENFGSRSAHLFTEAGHQVETVLQERLGGASDDVIHETCIRENRCLVSLDLDFADILRFPPDQTAGIAVLRLPNGAFGCPNEICERPVDHVANRANHGAALDRRGKPDSRSREHQAGRGKVTVAVVRASQWPAPVSK